MNLEEIKSQAKKEIEAVKEIKDLENWRIKYLGRKSDLSLFFDNLKKIPLDQRKKEAQQAHNIRLFLIDLFKSKEKDFLEREENNEYLDLSQPGIKKEIGHLHPISLVLEEIVEIFRSLGFEVIEGPEIETEYYNFDALRIPETHPARDMWDTLWITSKMLLRTHTSPMQIRYMEKHQPPFRIIVPGKTFRHEATDASHEIQFHQVEGLMVSKNINFSNFKFIIEEFLKAIFKNNILIRFRPSYFPFVTPGVEVDIKIRSKFKEQKSKVNQNEWLEIMGAGMVHPDLYKIVGYKEKNLQGFAFGLGVERIAMIKYKISDIRLFTSSDIRFLKQM
ncbi:MAG TPA: phenylalanine--tRNA ligase subunit alpha [Candidatus Paceibacterota bacterium]|nr:phenylalanine--tRNA ligase subunit alpha [Candidatus Paceibacterota bacterium]HOK97336.1 phenylalanine--tRNA ligase subunit alpha [Candidatus Paceibacterota bacterium]HPP64770.1 phenylalanine--tRNA ligase subunit alpha [Candidatus Paceibacterota bacterium]